MVRGCLRCVDGVSRNIPRDDCRVTGKGYATPDDLWGSLPRAPIGPVAAAPAPGLYAMPEGGWVYGLPGDYPGAPGSFGGFYGGAVWVHDAHTGEWVEHDAPTPLPVGFTPLLSGPRLEVPVPIGHGTPMPGMVQPPPEVPVPVPEPAAAAVFGLALAVFIVVLARRSRT
ncbi:hypothetical protein EAH89_17140 [Roseomonas nepalensis]|uniref:Uncharacterized protein n=1 Tax=Muricoccus nepalensis TaxID=1854500 RepID=A0A502FUX2_9PROT|nr:hypothetical protein [Roseomonas nepalensis]TPG53244.1 hypothetical protein EAH89_17140 [Roseomonas nepalensis]